MHFAEALRALMTERGVSGNALAHTVYCDKALISRLVNGKQQPSASMARLLDDALGAGGKLAAVARRGGTTGAQASMEEGETVSVPCQTSDGRIIFVDVPRRLLLRGAAAAALAAAVPAGSQPELNGEPAATRFAIARRVLRDSDNQQAAQYWLDRPLEWSHHAGDDGSVAFILARKSQLAADMGDPAGAVAVAEAAMKRATPD